jgi:hypothetical protein
MKIVYILLLILYQINAFINIYTTYQGNLNLNSNIKKNNNINFVIWKGYAIPSKNYIEFSKSIIDKGLKNNININVTICDRYNLPNLNNTILFGHSAGGYHCINNKDNVKARITYGASPKSIYDNTIFNIKNKEDINILNIIGEYDGYISYNKLLEQKYYNYEYNIKNNKLICTKSNHLCIVENKKTFISTLLCKYDQMLDIDYNIMMNDVSKTIISYILYLNNKNTTIHNYRYTKEILKKNLLFEITSYRHFLRTKPDVCKTYLYLDYNKNFTYIKTSGILGDMLLELLEYKCEKNIFQVDNTLKWLFNKNREILYFRYAKKDFKYFRLPYIIK